MVAGVGAARKAKWMESVEVEEAEVEGAEVAEVGLW